ncbi:MAG: hypothetical protein OFPII_34670 [Osedax symbiont Rs1]|nr:MAG: hypothetical protein OFPII_34670 [Osedax symbiont Rs1]
MDAILKSGGILVIHNFIETEVGSAKYSTLRILGKNFDVQPQSDKFYQLIDQDNYTEIIFIKRK